MSRTPGLIVPSGYSSEEELLADLKRRNEMSGFTPFDEMVLDHSDDVDDFLEHFGIRGMRWGVRKKNTTYIPPNPHMGKKKMSNKKKAVIGGAAGVAAIGAVFAAKFIKGRMGQSTRSIKPSAVLHGRDFATKMFSEGGRINLPNAIDTFDWTSA